MAEWPACRLRAASWAADSRCRHVAAPQRGVRLLLVVIEFVHQAVQLAALLLGGAARAAVAEYEDGLARNVEIVQLLDRKSVV